MKKILIFSDLYWDESALKINSNEILPEYSEKTTHYSKFFSLIKYTQVINKEEPDTIIFAGDLTGDGSCGHGFHHIFFLLLDFCDSKNIDTYFLRGDHDDDESWEFIVENSKKLQRTKELINSTVNINGLNVLGVSFFYVSSRVDSFKKGFFEKVDITVSHCELKARPWFINSPTNVFITGHYDHKICDFDGRKYVSLDADINFVNYCSIEHSADVIKSISYKFYGYNGLKLFYSISTLDHGILPGEVSHIIQCSNGREYSLKLFESLTRSAIFNLYWRSSKEEKDIYLLPDWPLFDQFTMKHLRGVEFKVAVQMLIDFKNGNTPEIDLNYLTDLHVNQYRRISKTLIYYFVKSATLKLKDK